MNTPTPIRTNASGVVTIPFHVVGTGAPALAAIIAAIGVRLV